MIKEQHLPNIKENIQGYSSLFLLFLWEVIAHWEVIAQLAFQHEPPIAQPLNPAKPLFLWGFLHAGNFAWETLQLRNNAKN
jgi:hypothetical protein